MHPLILLVVVDVVAFGFAAVEIWATLLVWAVCNFDVLVVSLIMVVALLTSEQQQIMFNKSYLFSSFHLNKAQLYPFAWDPTASVVVVIVVVVVVVIVGSSKFVFISCTSLSCNNTDPLAPFAAASPSIDRCDLLAAVIIVWSCSNSNAWTDWSNSKCCYCCYDKIISNILVVVSGPPRAATRPVTRLAPSAIAMARVAGCVQKDPVCIIVLL